VLVPVPEVASVRLVDGASNMPQFRDCGCMVSCKAEVGQGRSHPACVG
jgi:hypothetical protein